MSNKIKPRLNRQELDNLYHYYLSDYMHNFGGMKIHNLENGPQEFTIPKKDTLILADLFVLTRYISYETMPVEVISSYTQFMNMLGFKKEFQKEIEQYYEKATNEDEKRLLLYKINITALKQIQPNIVDKEYSFEDSYPQSLEDLDGQIYTIKSNFTKN